MKFHWEKKSEKEAQPVDLLDWKLTFEVTRKLVGPKRKIREPPDLLCLQISSQNINLKCLKSRSKKNQTAKFWIINHKNALILA